MVKLYDTRLKGNFAEVMTIKKSQKTEQKTLEACNQLWDTSLMCKRQLIFNK